MATWRQFRSRYLDELIRRDGLGGADDNCALCPASQSAQRAEYRCSEAECINLGLLCRECCVRRHKHLPLHFIERWNEAYFEHSTLRELGLSMQLGHSADATCPQRYITTSDFTVLHTNGIHCVSLFFCGCTFAPPAYVQLLRLGWWPATPLEPRTASTFSLLRSFHYLNTLGKLPAWDMWQGLQAMTMNRSSVIPPNRYKVLLRSIRQWRHVKMMKRGGRGHDEEGIEGTSEGELAMQCPACPHPGINLPSNWRQMPTKLKFLYRLLLAVDANFRARNAVVSTPERDPPLADGIAHFIPSLPYQAHIRSHVNEDDMAACSGFKAMFLANSKNIRGLRTTGIVGVTCSRHGLWRANGMGDLQRGERFCNVDPPVAASLKADEMLEVVVSYDIACNYIVHFWERMARLPEHWRMRFEPRRVTFCIPKFHLWAHKSACHGPYSFNYLPGAGRTDGETIERNWAVSNRAAAQTKMMGPGARQDTLEDIFAAHNFRTVQGFGRLFLRKLAEAVKEAHVHAREFVEFDAGLTSLLGKPLVQEWLEELVAWEQDHDQPCPYESQLEEHETLKDVETLQYVDFPDFRRIYLLTILRRALAWEVKARRSGTTYQEVNIEKQRGLITRMITRIRGLQRIFMPSLREYLTPQQLVHIDSPSSVLAEETKLFLPSELKKRDRVLDRACAPGLVDAEARLREAECREALEDLRQGLRTRSVAHMFTVRNVTGQNPTTRAEGLQRKIQIGIQLNKLRYRWARNALFQLKGHGEWERELKILNDTDIRGLTERMLSAQEQDERNRLRDLGIIDESVLDPASSDAVVAPGEGRRRVSWIWYTPTEIIPGDDDASAYSRNTALKIEWCKARARKLRWQEEVELLLEEMRRVVEFHRWSGSCWRARVNARGNVSPELRQGISAFAREQAARQTDLADGLERKWAAVS
ncbi:hypothetical protein BDZ89DRAFT_959732 [Hymenopellis radicata]|nr:hypothetical protein BDZ89DRAFT_959732 [Hymenopellis radicata]